MRVFISVTDQTGVSGFAPGLRRLTGSLSRSLAR